MQRTENPFDVGSSVYREDFFRPGKVTRQKLTEAETSYLLTLTALSLSAFNVNNCRFVVVRDPDLRKQIHKFAVNQSQIPHFSSLIILCADLQGGEKKSEANGSNNNNGEAEATTTPRKKGRQDQERQQRDDAMCSCGIAAQTFMLTAKAMGFDSWRLDGFHGEGIGKLINLPEDYLVGLILLVGKNLKPACPNGRQINIHDIMVLDQF
ncbi:MAG: nitroreductase family protein [Desulfobaccales bacterium]